MNKGRKIAFFLLFQICSAFAQDISFDHIGIDNGMSQNQVNAITKDKNGFMWFGTWDGLNRYDGTKFDIFKHEPFDTSSLSSSFITAILCDKQNRLWVGTSGGGLNLWQPLTSTFYKIIHQKESRDGLSNNDVRHIYEDTKGRIWVSTAYGLNKIEVKNDKFHVEQIYPQGLQNSIGENDINSITELSPDKFAIASNQGLFILAYTSNNVQFYYVEKLNSVRNHHNSELLAKTIFLDSVNHLWIGTNHGLFMIQNPHDEYDSFQIEAVSAKENSHGSIGCKPITFINQDSKKQLWVGTENGGLFTSTEAKKFPFVEIKQEKIQMNYSGKVTFTNLFQSKDEKIIWIGTDIDGVKKLTTTHRNFDHIEKKPFDNNSLLDNAVFSVYQDQNYRQWFGTTEGFSIYEQKENLFHNYRNTEGVLKEISNSKIRAFLHDSQDRIWIGSSSGLSLFDASKLDPTKLEDSFKSKYTSSTSENSLPSPYIYSLFEDSHRNIWIGTSAGVCIYNESYDNFVPISYLPEGFYNQGQFMVKYIFEDSKNAVWLATNGGLHQLRSGKGQFQFSHFNHNPLDTNTICSDEVNHIIEAQDGSYWIATAHGFSHMTLKNNETKISHFTKKEGLPNEFIYAIFEDKQRKLWMSSNRGIIVFEPESGLFKNFEKEDGIQSNEFNLGSFYQCDDGKILLGGLNGITSFYPEDIDENEHIPQVVITGIERFDKGILDFHALQQADQLEFDYDENNFSVDFIALDYTNPRKNQYAYMLEGVDKSWVHIGQNRSVTFSNLQPGNYKFKVKGSNNNGIWNEKAASFKFSIMPPFWQRPGFFIAIGAFLILFFILFYRFKLNANIKKVLAEEKIRQSLNDTVRKKAAADFHDEMGHYLTRINVLTEILKQRMIDAPGELSGIVKNIGDQSQKLYEGTRDFIWTFNPENNSVYEIIIRIKDFGDDLFNDTNIEFKFSGLDESLKERSLSTDAARHLILIFKEAINNIVKHANATSVSLVVEVYKNSNIPYIELTDNGQGIPENHKHFGNGLKNMRKRSQKIHAQLKIISATRGTIIRLSPFDIHKVSEQKTA